MITRILNVPKERSFFLLGPRGTGKTLFVRRNFPDAIVIDLLRDREFSELVADPDRLEKKIPPGHNDWVILDEVQRLPALLNTVHRLIEERKLKFILTGSSARKLRRGGINLLGGRAAIRTMHPFVAQELKEKFELKQALRFGTLPLLFDAQDPSDVLKSYVGAYLREEIKQEGIVRNIGDFARFLETASLSQASLLNIANVARDSAVPYETTHDYFQVLEDLLIAERVPLFAKRAKRRRPSAHPKFFFFDAGVYRALRPQGPLDSDQEIDGPCLETLFFQHARALNEYLALDYSIYYWQSPLKQEVDFVLYGKRGLLAFEIKRASKVRSSDLAGLREFSKKYPEAVCIVLYGGAERFFDEFHCIPYETGLRELDRILSKGGIE